MMKSERATVPTKETMMSYEDELNRYAIKNARAMAPEEVWRWKIKRIAIQLAEQEERRRSARERARQRKIAKARRVAALRALIAA